ncbi:hypothetical protein [Oceanithermus sp.]|uniref:hypothetical protein n=1 Tax=Oceanithermus sp. TaxID=2268145 RepID=UPI00257D404C|nr:hypothetical protein [Oceanithermus sp.]
MIGTVIWLSAYALFTVVVWTLIYVALRGIVSLRELLLVAAGSAVGAWLLLWLMWRLAGWLA